MQMTGKKLKITVPDSIAGLVPYPPGKPIEELEREIGIAGSIKLASNENPLGPSPMAVEAVKGVLMKINRYPDGSCFYLKRRLSEFVHIDGECIVVGNGSNEIIELLVRTFLEEGDEAVMGDPSFAVYPLVVQAAGARAVRVPLSGLRIDLAAIRNAVTSRTRLVFISNPNNPTGTIVSGGELTRFLDGLPEGVIVCLDEAYYEYVTDVDFPDSIGYVREGRPVVVLRTFSKIYGLAGLRIGYGVAHPTIVDYLNRVRQPFNVNSLAQTAACAALDDSDHVERSRECNVKGLGYLFGEMRRMGFDCVPTQANFFLVKVGDGAAVYDGLLRRGVIVRPMAGYGLDEYIRVTVGTPEENRRFVEAFEEVVSAGK